jgi:GAF domain-containing protein
MNYVKISRSLKAVEPVSFDPDAKPSNESERLMVLRKLNIFNTPSEELFSLYTELAAVTLKTPIALTSFVEDQQVFYKESYGIGRTGELVNRRNSPCTLAILTDQISVFRYALTDPCILADAKNLEEVGYKFYAGAPLLADGQFNIGVLAVVDRKIREYSTEELGLLADLAEEVMREVKLRLSTDAKSLNEKLRLLRQRIEKLR